MRLLVAFACGALLASVAGFVRAEEPSKLRWQFRHGETLRYVVTDETTLGDQQAGLRLTATLSTAT